MRENAKEENRAFVNSKELAVSYIEAWFGFCQSLCPTSLLDKT
jgi:hypothetical protein